MSEDEKKKPAEEEPEDESEAEESDESGDAEPGDAEPGEAKAEAKSSGEDESASGDEDEDEDEEDEEEEQDSASPEAIAKRLEALGGDEEEDDERLAREEEAKLAARRTKERGPKKKKKAGLDAAASRRLAKIGTKAKPRKRAVPEAVEAADPIIDRTQRFGDWAKRNTRLVQAAAVAIVLGGIGLGVYAYHEHSQTVAASAALSEAVADEQGMIGNPDDDDDSRPKPPIKVFATVAARQDAALAKYRETATTYPGTGAATLARLGEGSLLLDKQDAKGAMAAFNEVIASPLAMADPEVKGRAMEGLGFAYELEAVQKPDQKDKDLDAALQQYKQMEASDVLGFSQMARYHEARCYETKGDKAKAIEILKKLYEDLTKAGSEHLFDALKESTEGRLRRLDPTALPARKPHIGANGELPPELINQLPPELRAKLLHQQKRAPE